MKLILCCAHHKTGTALFGKIMRSVAKELHLKLQVCKAGGSEDELEPDTDIWVHWNRVVSFRRISRPYCGSHIIRDPRDVIVSGYFYHLKGVEKWSVAPRPDLGGKSYQEHLAAIGQEEGLLFEMTHTAKFTIERMSAWDYSNPHILELKYEDLIKEYEHHFRRIFSFYGFSGQDLEKCLAIADRHNINKLSDEKIAQVPHIHSREPSRWKNHFTARHKELFKELFGDVLVKLGYEKDNRW